jgi:putative ribosome biogenesis GTPase RsgA
MILYITFAHYKLLLLQCVQVQLNFSMNQRLRIHYRRRNRKRHFCSFRNQRGRIARGDRVSYEEEEGRKGKVAAKVAVI